MHFSFLLLTFSSCPPYLGFPLDFVTFSLTNRQFFPPCIVTDSLSRSFDCVAEISWSDTSVGLFTLPRSFLFFPFLFQWIGLSPLSCIYLLWRLYSFSLFSPSFFWARFFPFFFERTPVCFSCVSTIPLFPHEISNFSFFPLDRRPACAFSAQLDNVFPWFFHESFPIPGPFVPRFPFFTQSFLFVNLFRITRASFLWAPFFCFLTATISFRLICLGPFFLLFLFRASLSFNPLLL